ncbi:MAG: ATP-dependent DNA ligase [Verrucomicrobiota bacterium]
MRRFAQLFSEVDESNRTSTKLRALEAYFREAPAEDAAWALYFLMGNRLRAPVKTALLREWAAEVAGLPGWLIDESYHTVGDLAETLALLLPDEPLENPPAPLGQTSLLAPEIPEVSAETPLHKLVEQCIVPLGELAESDKKRMLLAVWSALGARERFIYNKLITGNFRVGVQRTLVGRALAKVAGQEPAVMAHRLMGQFEPRPEAYRALMSTEAPPDDPAKPYPFYLAYPLEDKQTGDLHGTLGAAADWQIEWKWDGIRAQLIKRQGEVVLWSRGEDLIGERFPEVVQAAERLPDGTVLDGELLCWREGRPLPFASLQRRIGRKDLTDKVLREAPAAMILYDCLESDGQDRREAPLEARRAILEHLASQLAAPDRLLASPLVPTTGTHAADWPELIRLRSESRERGVEGFMLKRRGSPYKAGRVKGDWWKWKIEPFTIDAVMIYAQSGHGRRAGLDTDYTFAVWEGDALVPIAKAYSGLTDAEIARVDQWVKRHTRERHGPVRIVDPELVFELAFEGINPSTRHKSGLALRFPRINRWREDKPATQANTLDDLRALIP